jgi:hypothetical protein
MWSRSRLKVVPMIRCKLKPVKYAFFRSPRLAGAFPDQAEWRQICTRHHNTRNVLRVRHSCVDDVCDTFLRLRPHDVSSAASLSGPFATFNAHPSPFPPTASELIFPPHQFRSQPDHRIVRCFCICLLVNNAVLGWDCPVTRLP